MNEENKKSKMTPIKISQKMQKKIDLYMQYFKEQTEETFNFMENYFRTRTVLPPIIFKIIVGPEVIQRILDQKMIVLEIASQMGSNGTIKDLVPLIEERERKYYQLDSYLHNFRRRDKMYPEAQRLIKKWFLFRVNADEKNLTGEGETWFEILRSVHDRKSGAAVINEEIEIVKELMDLVRNNRSLVNVPGVVKVEVIDSMIAMSEQIITLLFKQIDEVWPE